MATKKKRGGLAYSPDGHVIGKTIYRVREQHIADHIAPMVRRRQYGAAKLDLVLRGLALREQDLGARQVDPGFVLPRYRYEDLHDLCRPHTHFRGRQAYANIDQSRELAQKSEWVRSQLDVLQQDYGLVERHIDGAGRPTLYVLSDRGDGEFYDDPSGEDGAYITLPGAVIACGALAEWKAAELVGYLAALVAARRDRTAGAAAPGEGRWWRQAWWFADVEGKRVDSGIPIPFSESTVKRGIDALVANGWIEVEKTDRNPDTGRRLARRRNVYTNRFTDRADLAQGLEVSLDEILDRELPDPRPPETKLEAKR